VFKGLWELISSFSGGIGEMSEETATALESAGLLDTVVWLFGLFVRLREVTLAVWGGISDGFEKAWTQMKPGLELLTRSLFDLFETLGNAAGLGELVQPGDLDAWTTFGNIIAAVFSAVFELAGFIVGALAASLAVVVKIVDWVNEKMWALREAIIGVGKSIREYIDTSPTIKKALSLTFDMATNPVGTMAKGAVSAYEALSGPAQPVATPAMAPNLTTPAMMRQEATAEQLSSMSSAVSQNQSRPIQVSSEVKSADVYLDGEKVGNVLQEISTRAQYTSHGR
jgi:hypothetical protein